MNEQLQQRVREIKQSFRQLMDGMTAQSMRDKDMAAEIGKDYELAIELWKADVRECKILATMVMPADRMLPEVVDIWMEQTTSQEIAEQAAFNLYQYLPYAPAKAYQWIAFDKELYQLCGFHILTRLFMNKQEPNERGINEFIDQALVALQGGSMMVRKAAMQSMIRFSELGLVYERMAKSALKKLNLELF